MECKTPEPKVGLQRQRCVASRTATCRRDARRWECRFAFCANRAANDTLFLFLETVVADPKAHVLLRVPIVDDIVLRCTFVPGSLVSSEITVVNVRKRLGQVDGNAWVKVTACATEREKDLALGWLLTRHACRRDILLTQMTLFDPFFQAAVAVRPCVERRSQGIMYNVPTRVTGITVAVEAASP